ncbi:hypothetical protein Tco_0225702, partial [Tanacetum coccineum]
LAPSDDEAPMEDQLLPNDASPVAPSPGYVPDADPEEDSEEVHADYPADGGDGDDKPSDDDDDDEDEEPFEDEGDDEEEEEHLASADSSAIPVVDPVPQLGIQRHLRLMSLHLHLDHLRLGSPLPRHVSVGHGRLSDLSHLCHHPWKDALLRAPLGYKAAGIRMRAATVSPPLLLPPTSHRTDILEAEIPPRRELALLLPLPDSRPG